MFNLSRWGVPSERGVIYHIQKSSIQAWSIAAFHRRPRPPQCLVSVFNAVKLSQIKSETGNNSPPRDQNSCPSIASECQQMAETSSFLSRRRRYSFPLFVLWSCWYLTFSTWSCLKITESCIEGKSPDNPRWNWWHSVLVCKLNQASILLWILDFPLSMLPGSSPSCNYLRPPKLKPDTTYEKETGSSVFLEKVRSQQFSTWDSSYKEGEVTEQRARHLFLPLGLREKLHPEEVSRCTFLFFKKKALMNCQNGALNVSF